MSRTSNGVAIIDGKLIPVSKVIPASEAEVLKVIFEFNKRGEKPTTSQIVERFPRDISDASCYTFCKRLDGRTGLVVKEEVKILVCGKYVRRVVWSVTSQVVEFFQKELEKNLKSVR